ncbi:MAG TPA: type II toxin-antitoxin system HicB family antitoxin [Verrucomicrobiae bacterium]|jgi:predicted RNase H-like HicB family nuclease
MKKLTYEIVIEREEDPKAGYSVYCPDLPGCFSNGGSVAEARENMAEAIGLHLESLRELGKRIPKPSHRLVVEELTIPEFA